MSDDPAKEPLPISADKITFTYPESGGTQPSQILLEGKVNIQHPSGTFSADRAEWDFEAGELIFTGNPVMDTPQMSGFKAGKFILNFNDNTWQATDASMDEYNMSKEGGKPSASDPAYLREGDLADWPGFLTAFKKQAASQQPTPAKHFLDLMDPEAKAALGAMTVDQLLVMKDIKPSFLKKMNQALGKADFYNKAAWAGTALSDAATALLEKGTLEPGERTRLNRLLFEAAFPGLVRAMPAEGGSSG
jgi:hypothetical protein